MQSAIGSVVGCSQDIQLLFGRLEAGEYHLAVGVPVDVGKSHGTVVASTDFEVTEPRGEDAECLRMLGDPLAHRDQVIKLFPTSVYAGWALAQTGAGASLSLDSGAAILEELRLPERDRQINSVSDYSAEGRPATAGEAAQLYVSAAAQFLASHIEHQTTTIVRMKLTMAYSVRGEWQRAFTVGTQANGSKWPRWSTCWDQAARWPRVLREYLDALKAHGFAKQ